MFAGRHQYTHQLDARTVEQAAPELQVHPNTLYRAKKARKLKCVKVGRLVRIRRSDLDAYLERKGD